MSPTKAKPRKTAEDYRRLPEGTRAELIEGELLMSPSPRRRHQRAVVNLTGPLRAHVLSTQSGEVFVAWTPHGYFKEGDILTTPVFPMIGLPVEQIF